MSLVDRKLVLVLNSGWQPIGIKPVKDAICDIVNGTVKGLDITYQKLDENNKPILETVNMSIVNSWEDWVKLDVFEYHNSIRSAKLSVRMPTVVIAYSCHKITMKRIRPTKDAIRNRDGSICQYTGKKIDKRNGSIDHIVPVSKGGKWDWENMVWCSTEINRRKSDKSLEESGLRLIRKPNSVKPIPFSATINEVNHLDWNNFLV